MSGKDHLRLLVPTSMVWVCPACQAVNAIGLPECRCGRKQGKDPEVVKTSQPVGSAWVCPTCRQVNAHTRTRCACGSDRPMQAVEGKPESGKVERRGRVPIKEKLNKTEAKFLREHLEPLLGRTLQHIIPQVTLPFPDGTSYRIDFFCVTIEGFVKCYEVKGSYDLNFAWAEQGIERFRRARDLWPGLNFELWRKAKTGKNEKGLEQWVRRM